MARAHEWMDDACLRCGLHRREEWLLDRARRPVLALVWTDRSGDRQVQPFPPLKGLEPPIPPSLTLAEAFPGTPGRTRAPVWRDRPRPSRHQLTRQPRRELWDYRRSALLFLGFLTL